MVPKKQIIESRQWHTHPKFRLVVSKYETMFQVSSKVLIQWCHGLVVITIVQLHSTKLKLRFCAGSNLACGESEIRNGEDL